jgi:hypothetical protein
MILQKCHGRAVSDYYRSRLELSLSICLLVHITGDWKLLARDSLNLHVGLLCACASVCRTPAQHLDHFYRL